MKYIISLLFVCLFFNCRQITLASCGAATCPLNNHQYLKSGTMFLGLTHEYINQDQIYIGSSRAYVGAIQNGHHDEVQTLNERNIFQLQYGISDVLGLSITLPFIHREHLHISHENGTDAWESWNFSGLGDMTIGGQLAIVTPSEEFKPYVDLVFGTKLPTGLTDAVNGEGEEGEVTIQPGTGSLDGFVGFNYRQTLFSVPTVSGSNSALPFIFNVTYQIAGKGTDNYRFGNVFQVHLGTAYQFADHASFLLQLNGKFQGFADVGLTDEPRENTGGTWFFISPGIGLQLSDALSGAVYFQEPVAQDVHGIQQTSKFNLLFALSYNFDLFSSQ
jgi:hypothetical protein